MGRSTHISGIQHKKGPLPRKICKRCTMKKPLGGEGKKECIKKESQNCFDEIELPKGWYPDYPKFHLIYISFKAIKDPEMRAKLDAMPTDFQLTDKQNDLLIEAANMLLDQSKEYHEVLEELRAEYEKKS